MLEEVFEVRADCTRAPLPTPGCFRQRLPQQLALTLCCSTRPNAERGVRLSHARKWFGALGALPNRTQRTLCAPAFHVRLLGRTIETAGHVFADRLKHHPRSCDRASCLSVRWLELFADGHIVLFVLSTRGPERQIRCTLVLQGPKRRSNAVENAVKSALSCVALGWRVRWLAPFTCTIPKLTDVARFRTLWSHACDYTFFIGQHDRRNHRSNWRPLHGVGGFEDHPLVAPLVAHVYGRYWAWPTHCRCRRIGYVPLAMCTGSRLRVVYVIAQELSKSR